MSASKKSNDPAPTRTIRVAALARVEGEGALHLAMKDGQVDEVRLDIYEPPRFYEAFLRGRDFREVPDLTARICGICPIAYQSASCFALEKAMGVFEKTSTDPLIQPLRDLIYCGEWIESHILHMFLLHLPDFLGYESAISMVGDHGDTVKRALRIKKLGNDLVSVLGGRSVHPVGMAVGGFHGAPDPAKMAALLPEIKACLDDMCELTLFLADAVEYPDLEQDYEFVALAPETGYPINLGRIKSSKGLDVDQEEYDNAVEEIHVKHSTALHSVIKGRGPYMVGPLARLNLTADRLNPRAAELLPKVCDAVGKTLPWQNNFYSLPARGLETIHALALAAEIIENYQYSDNSCVEITPRAGEGGHGTEAPRGICWHRYRTNDDGSIAFAQIMPPTAQNQPTIESDLRIMAQRVLDLPDEEAALKCEHLIRNYDPCISCSVHFLNFTRSWNKNA